MKLLTVGPKIATSKMRKLQNHRGPLRILYVRSKTEDFTSNFMSMNFLIPSLFANYWAAVGDTSDRGRARGVLLAGQEITFPRIPLDLEDLAMQ